MRIDWWSEAADWRRRAHYAIVFIAMVNLMNRVSFKSVNTGMNTARRRHSLSRAHVMHPLKTNIIAITKYTRFN